METFNFTLDDHQQTSSKNDNEHKLPTYSSISRIDKMMAIQKEAFTLFEKKNKDYGDAFAQHGSIGVMIRMNDKINRYLSVKNRSIEYIKTETLRDTLIDLHNYAAMAIMLLDEENNQK